MNCGGWYDVFTPVNVNVDAANWNLFGRVPTTLIVCVPIILRQVFGTVITPLLGLTYIKLVALLIASPELTFTPWYVYIGVIEPHYTAGGVYGFIIKVELYPN